MNKNPQIELNTDTYIAQFPQSVQDKLNALRKCIQQAAPEAFEKISYQMPTFDLHGNLVHFAAFQNHIGFYPGSSGVEAFTSKLTAYHTSKGAIQFPIQQDIPFDLVKDIVMYRVKENMEKHQQKLIQKKKK
ncbi:MAG TPA: hypothetical protein DEG42_04640 [Acholeplasmataceae bacterium]|nr:MAG: hypothetical protein A2Y43_02905 [Tenericutes bacterium GWA2_38_26]OHE30295.1 MAG: hypothetical protein A2084_02380 [Tenericutes bacterium GWC2_39_45]OHE32063.1 MAG: hypothetical protein A2009_03005 [Tenericutes bacterium GWD2_38_27]OHE39966.1 MAG: hypothetical protein A2102_03700 [Tenericutes bacterium GWF2_38_8]HBG33740.1 hypothetical protein [Acholeplasmataceae bacterium]